jgi:hypothetical protein
LNLATSELGHALPRHDAASAWEARRL